MQRHNINEGDSENLLDINKLYVTYHTEENIVYAVNGIDLSIKRGETLGLVGETGAGKTTTALSIMRLLPKKIGEITSGTIHFNGLSLLDSEEKVLRDIRGSKISMIFQDPMTSLNPLIKIGDQILEVFKLHNHENLSKAELNNKVDEILNLVGIEAIRKQEYPHQFSGGMKQRVVIAMALACNPELLIADEPTTALDVTIQAQVLEKMNDLKRTFNTSMIMITHDLGIVARLCDRIAIMYAGEIIEKGEIESIFAHPRHPYTLGLFKSIPSMTTEAKRLQPIEGNIPDPSDLPKGCKFHERCPKAMPVCAVKPPAMVGNENHKVQCHLFNESFNTELE